MFFCFKWLVRERRGETARSKSLDQALAFGDRLRACAADTGPERKAVPAGRGKDRTVGR